tara:strand:- start:18116 stop:18709 length:594 start_codon:yes stop_codon:yes gene_type:complete
MREFNLEKILKTVSSKNPFPEEANSFKFLDIEIGAGTGMFALDYSLKNKNRALISVEKTSVKFLKFKNAFKKERRENLFPVHDNGISWSAHHLKKQSVDRFFFLYPNPNPKPGDLNKRFYAMPFMGFVISRLKDSGEIFFATNELFYRDEAITFMTKEWGLRLNHNIIIKKSDNPITLFEKKYLERGQPCYHFSFIK